MLPFFGQKIAGTYRWLNFGLPFGLQPSEIAKCAIVITLAKYLSDHNLQMKNFGSNIIPFLIALIPAFVVLSQPDLGTAFVMMMPIIPMITLVRFFISLVRSFLFGLLGVSSEGMCPQVLRD